MHHLKFAPSWLRFLTIFLLTMGILFRFSNLDGKVFWQNEVYASLRISGYTINEAKQQLFNNRVIGKESFAQFQGANPEKSLNDTIMSLAKQDSQHPPLYYIIARLWMEIFGNSVTAIRSLSACISLLVFPCVYWLCRELFNVPLSVSGVAMPAAGVAIALMAISPTHLVYAQEAQEYILWLVTILLSSASLLRAIRLEDELAKERQKPDLFAIWSIYAVTLAISLYTFLWSAFVAVAHGIYVMITAKFQFTETVRSYLLASLVGFLAFMPWITVVIGDFFQFLISADKTTPQSDLIPILPFLLMQLSRIFFDIDLSSENSLGYLIGLAFLSLVGYSIYFLCQSTNYKIWSFIITLIVVPALPLILPDLIAGSIQSSTEAYLIPSYLGIQVAVAYLLTTQLYNGRGSRRSFWHIIMALVIICGLISSKVSSQAETWWNKGMNYGNPQVAQIINQSNRPLLISDALSNNYGHVFSLSYLLEPKVRFLLVNNQKIPKIPDGFSDVFLLNPSEAWGKSIEKKYKFKTDIVYSDNYYSIWKLAKTRNLRRRNISPNNQLSAELSTRQIILQ
ncbi:MAG: glycosyltransferase family 39 protein [Nostoc sp. EfeVER01]|uniref:glycosyltransferase family 39 protein n=1 Tax=unclassified Nostoc TaxID=2593658 RepID=UPI002AD4FD44|nr:MULTISPECIES: glycosyltransferase family 39 protein [unclassified Nostoc]MDZ7947087.1 glycosyltransferase family 39 protein [Nostoc sp. EfeVER01]MDZ7991512.1 glycosyltransferase family 39 protein [Nostoc sp. EspVER01]